MVRRRITWAVILLGLTSYALVATMGDQLSEAVKHAIVLIVVGVAVSADAWELGVRTIIDRKRWLRVGILSLVAIAGMAWLLLGR